MTSWGYSGSIWRYFNLKDSHILKTVLVYYMCFHKCNSTYYNSYPSRYMTANLQNVVISEDALNH